MTVIVIGSVKIDSNLIGQIAKALGTGSGDVIRVLKYIAPRDPVVRGIALELMGINRRIIEGFSKHEEMTAVDRILGDVNDIVSFPIGHFDIRSLAPIEFPCFHINGHSWHPNHGEPCDHLWVNPSVIHDQLCALSGYVRTFFHRKCFMQLKTFSNLRF